MQHIVLYIVHVIFSLNPHFSYLAYSEDFDQPASENAGRSGVSQSFYLHALVDVRMTSRIIYTCTLPDSLVQFTMKCTSEAGNIICNVPRGMLGAKYTNIFETLIPD